MSVAIIAGSSKGIGLALTHHILRTSPTTTVLALSRTHNPSAHDSLDSTLQSRLRPITMDLTRESDLERVAREVEKEFGKRSVRQVWMVAGTLTPEKSLRGVKEELVWEHFRINTVAPMMAAKHWHGLLAPPVKSGAGLVGFDQSWWVNLSARTGSIGDNKLGGWYSYRMSKAALNMLTKTMAIEVGRLGTVDTDLSRKYTPSTQNKFTAQEAAEKMHDAVSRLKTEDSGGFFDYKGDRIVW
ncbi:hypothetical protein HDU98_002418 [Podochytrium sp. JEL0797]|nr:hypothetical protein HDU98_002418 [Podochytrium sp. JEL0797]